MLCDARRSSEDIVCSLIRPLVNENGAVSGGLGNVARTHPLCLFAILAQALGAMIIAFHVLLSLLVALIMVDRESKLRRLNEFRRDVPHVSARALSAILTKAKREGLPELHSRSHITSARDISAYEDTPYGLLQQTVQLEGVRPGTHVNLELQHPLAMLYHACKQGGSFSALMQSRLASHPPSPSTPWHLVMYSDGVTPGDAFAMENRRKLQVVYFSFLELEPVALCREDAWFMITAKRETEISKVLSGMSQVVGACIKAFFCNGVNAALAGAMLSFPTGTSALLFLSLDIFVQDELAHKIIWHMKGSSGTCFCIKCINAFAAKSELDADDDSGLIQCAIIKDSDLVCHTDETLFTTVDRLAAANATDAPGEFKARQQRVGFTYTPRNMLYDLELRPYLKPISQYMHDMMHVLAAGGVINTTMYLVIETFRNFGLGYATFHAYVQEWKWPQRVGGWHCSSKNVFKPQFYVKSHKAKSFKCTASEAISILPLFTHFVRQAILPAARNVLRDTCNVVLALWHMTALCLNVVYGIVTPNELRDAVHHFLNVFVVTFGTGCLHQKFHALLHLPYELLAHGTLLACWVQERKHRLVLRYARDVCNTSAYERTILGEVTAHHLHRLMGDETFNFDSGLLAPLHEPKADMRRQLVDIIGCSHNVQVTTALVSRYNAFGICARGDFVLVKDGEGAVAGEVWYHAEINGVPVSLISVWELHVTGEHHREWVDAENPQLYETEAIINVLTGCRSNGVVTTLMPLDWQRY